MLHVFDAATPERIVLSDKVCTALQIVEHCQDVGEDFARGRVYLPAEDLRAFGCTDADLAAATTPTRLRGAVTRVADRASALLDEGEPLVRGLDGWAGICVAGYLAGGRATLAALRAGGLRRPRPAAAPEPGPHASARRSSSSEVSETWSRPPPTNTASASSAPGPATSPTASACCPGAKRQGMSAVYAFARRVDDIGDGEETREVRLARLRVAREDLHLVQERVQGPPARPPPRGPRTSATRCWSPWPTPPAAGGSR